MACPDRSRRWATAAAVVAAAGLTAAVAEWIGARHGLGPVDDAYISLRYADNWADGRGLAFNPGETVEGYTNFLLVLFEAGAIRCGLDPLLAMKLPGRMALPLLGGLVALWMCAHLFPGKPAHAAAVAAVATLNPAMVCWSFSGLESCLYALLLTAAVLSATAADRARWLACSAFCLILAGMARPEGAAFLPVVLAVVYLRCRSVRRAALWAGIFAAGFGTYFAMRALHFGYLFPNTFYAKLDYGGPALALRGCVHLWDFVRAAPLLMLLCAVALYKIRGSPLWLKACLLGVALQVLIVVYVGGDHFAMFRFFVPVLPLLMLAALYPFSAAAVRRGPADPHTSSVILLGLLVIGGSDLLIGQQKKRGELTEKTQFQRFASECEWARQWADIGEWFAARAPADESLCTIAIGAVGYHSGLSIVDPHGIVNPGIAHQRQELGRGYAGHEKFDVDHVLDRRPGYILVPHVLVSLPVPVRSVDRVAWGDFNRALVARPELHRAYRYVWVSLNDAFLNFFVRRDLPTPGDEPTAREPQAPHRR